MKKTILFFFAFTYAAITYGQNSGFNQGQGGSAVSGGSGSSGTTSNATPNKSGKEPALEKCEKPLGTMAVSEPQDYVMQALQQQGLPKPNGLIRIMIQ